MQPLSIPKRYTGPCAEKGVGSFYIRRKGESAQAAVKMVEVGGGGCNFRGSWLGGGGVGGAFSGEQKLHLQMNSRDKGHNFTSASSSSSSSRRRACEKCVKSRIFWFDRVYEVTKVIRWRVPRWIFDDYCVRRRWWDITGVRLTDRIYGLYSDFCNKLSVTHFYLEE